MHPQTKIVGETPDGKIRAIAVNSDGSLPIGISVDNLIVEASPLYQQVLNAPDYTRTIEYADAGVMKSERITKITCMSATLGLAFVDTYSYQGSSGAYQLTSITRSRS